MAAVDTSSLIAFLIEGPHTTDGVKIADAIRRRALVIPPIVVTEMLSDAKTAARVAPFLADIPVLMLRDGYWERAGAARAKVISQRFKAALADTLIAQACIDADVALITRDKDFRHFEKHCGLKLA